MTKLSKEVQEIVDRIDLPHVSRFFPGWWKKDDCIKNPKAIFVFGDNDIQKGCGGQAIIRHYHNAIGIPTKKFPSYARTAYYTDHELKRNKKKIIEAIENLIITFDSGDYDTIFFPNDGLGTGLSQLDMKAPKTLKFLNEIIYELFDIDYDPSSSQDSELSDSSE